MKFNFRKVASVIASVAMLGSTMGIAAAANYPAPYVINGVADAAIVIGASAAAVDNIAATDISSDLQLQLAKQTATATSTGATASGEFVNLATSNTKIYFNSSLNAARSSVTSTDLPTLLADGSVVDSSGTVYSFKQSFALPADKYIGFGLGASGSLTDPKLLIDVGTSTNYSSNLYRYTVSFGKALNVSHTDVQGQAITLMGQKYIIGAQSGGSGATFNLYLYRGGVTVEMNEGESKTVSIDGKDYAVKINSISTASGSNVAYVSVDGSESKRIAEGNTSKVGAIDIYAKRVDYLAKTGTVSSAIMQVGTKKILLTQTQAGTGSTVKEGADATSIQGTAVNITNSTADSITGFSVAVAMQKGTKDYLSIGDSFTDPVFGGVALQFVSITPALDSSSRENIVIDSDNNLNLYIKFTSYLAGSAGEKRIGFAHDQNSATSAVTPRLADVSNKTIHVVENDTIRLNEYMVVDSGDYGRILQLTDSSTTSSSSDYITFTDAITAENFKVVTGANDRGTLSIDGQTYYVTNMSATQTTATAGGITLNWGGTAGYSNPGGAISVFPRIKLKSGEWLIFATESRANATDIDNDTKVYLPGTETLYSTISTLSNATANYTVGNIIWSMPNNASLMGSLGNISALFGDGGAPCNFSKASGPAIVLFEEHKQGDANGDAICIPSTTAGTTTVTIAVGTPVWTDVSSMSLVSLGSNSYKSQGYDRYGTFVELDTTNSHSVSIKYPDTQMEVGVLITAVGASTSGAGSVGNVASLGSVAVLDSEIASVSSKNLIVVGGSCINKAAAKLLGSDSPICGADFTTKTGISSDQFIVKVFESPYATGKTAMLVAGYEGADTRKAATWLISTKPDTTIGKEYKKQTATYADVATA
ncbi:hypothetical protein HZA33_01040 [Candidatus Pacearchaeota archaeon]|nr:hypothetical protein [Candidatus Pacearchaeota archaeon]